MNCVLLAGPDHFKQAQITKALVAFRKAPLQDAARMARLCWGIVAEGLSDDEAKTLIARLADMQLEAVAVPALKALPEVKPIAAAKLGDALSLRFKAGGEVAVPWEEIDVLAAASYRVKTLVAAGRPADGPSPAQKALSTGVMLATGLPIRFGARSSASAKPVEQIELAWALDVCARGERFRIATAFDWSCLGPKMQPGGWQNFMTLVAEIAERAPKALRTRGARVLTGAEPAGQPGYESIADLERETRWLLSLPSPAA